MLLVSLSALLLSAEPAELPPIRGELGQFARISQVIPEGGIPSGDLPVVSKNPKCRDVLFLSRVLGGGLRAVQQISAWLEKQPELATRLFGTAKPLFDLSALTPVSTLSTKSTCGKALFDADRAPTKWCPAAADRDRGDFWFLMNKQPVAVVRVERVESTSCRSPVVGLRMFDGKGRLRLLASLGAATPDRLRVFGDGCQVFDFTEDSAIGGYRAQMRSCKP